MKGIKYMLIALVVMSGLGLSCCGLQYVTYPLGVAIQLTGSKGCHFQGQYTNSRETYRESGTVPATFTLMAYGESNLITANFSISPRTDSLGNTREDTLIVTIFSAGKPRATTTGTNAYPLVSVSWRSGYFGCLTD